MNRMLRIGFDLDNTLINYRFAAKKYAEVNGFEEPKDLANLRINLRAIGDSEWQKAQSWLYTKGLTYATPVTGWSHFLEKARENEVELFIVSHKTQFTKLGLEHLDLHSHAIKWLEKDLKILDIAQIRGVFFLPTREAKIEKLTSLNLDYFVDDLIEVLTDSKFPTNVKKMLFDSNSISVAIPSIASFFELAELIF